MKGAAGSGRHRSRELALQVLFALDLQRAKQAVEPDAGEAFEAVAANFEMPEAARAFARELVRGVVDDAAKIDEQLRAATRNWRLERMAVVDRNILRLATYELVATETPVAVVLDEAVQMAQRFADDRSPSFVNGVLDGVAKRVRSSAA